jgi:signal transduction histidine kinase
MFRVGIRAKLILVALVLLAIPLIGYTYVVSLDKLLRNALQQSVAATARAAATALHDRPALLERKPIPKPVPREDTFLEPEDTPPEPTLDPVKETDVIVRSLSRSEARIWVIDKRGRLLAIAGSLKSAARKRPSEGVFREAYPEDSQSMGVSSAGTVGDATQNKGTVRTGDDLNPPLPAEGHQPDRPASQALFGRLADKLTRAQSAYLQPLYARIFGSALLPRAAEDFDDSIPSDLLNREAEVGQALQGIAASAWRSTPDNRAVVIYAAHPVWNGQDVVAAVIVEETTNAVRSLTTDALEQLITITLIVFLLVSLTLGFFAARLTSRLMRLRNEAEAAIDGRGRVNKVIASSGARDEIGDLSRSFSTLLGRLGEYNHYLEHLASRLSHELRTPIAVVRSSLDNLALDPAGKDAQEYIDRANEGLERLNTILKRMSEASRLEGMLKETEKEAFDLADLVRGVGESYRSVYLSALFEIETPPKLPFHGAPDLIAQLLDKLAANAVSFNDKREPVHIRLTEGFDNIALTVTNSGPALPADLGDRLFGSMVSSRAAATSGSEPHLGLGLYMVKLIAEFHGGQAFAENRADGLGVTVGARWPKPSVNA